MVGDGVSTLGEGKPSSSKGLAAEGLVVEGR